MSLQSVQEEGAALLEALPDLGPAARWTVTNIGGGWIASLTVTTHFHGAKLEDLLARVAAGEPGDGPP